LISKTSYDDSDGNPYAGINSTTKLNFETEYLDLIPPVVTINPANGESDVSVSSSITISFDEAVRNLDDSPLTDTNVDSLITLKDTDASGVDIPFDATIDIANQVITINPSSNFDSEQVVYVAIGASVEDESDNAISATNSTFTVEDNLPPTLISTTPNDDAVNVGINDNLTMTFDEPVDVEFGTVTIYRSSDDSIFESMSVTSATQVAGGGTDTITINPANTMGYSTSYYVQVDSTAFDDSAGNSYAGFADSTTWNFTTAAENEPPVAVDDNHFTTEDTSVNVDVLSNDSDPNPADTLTITSVTQGSNGSVTNNSTYVTYNPDANFFGTDTFNYTIEDDQGASDTATVTITVTEVADINVSGDGVSISNGDSTPSTSDDTDFGSVQLYLGTAEHTFTIENLGTVVLALTGSPRVEITGAHAADFTVTSQPSSPLSNGETTTFSIEFDPSAAGLREAEVSIESDDMADPYTFAIQGTAAVNDSDGDGIIDNDEGDGDRDLDGVANYQDYDPTGYFYDENTGEILSGGLIEVTGPGDITIVEDGSEGYYQFNTDGTPGTYTMDVTAPSGYALSGACLQGDPPAYDPTGEAEPVNLGNSENADSGFLTSAVCTEFYLSFELEPGDPTIINNNFPLERLPLPDTGFAPEQVTDLALQPEKNAYQAMGYMQIEIPRIDVETSLVGIPAVDGAWDVSWLGTEVGYLEGSAFPTWPGNTVITGHVWNADDSPGIFVDLKNLRYGDLIYIHAWGKTYTYQVRSNRLVLPFDSRSVLEHRELDWVTLITCEGYAGQLGEYSYRRVVEAVLTEVTIN
jgi:LPXTG-site transpeptidase (sortase) family protein